MIKRCDESATEVSEGETGESSYKRGRRQLAVGIISSGISCIVDCADQEYIKSHRRLF